MRFRRDQAPQLGTLLPQYLDGLYSYALLISGNPADAEDLNVIT